MQELHMLHGCAPLWRRNVQSVRNYVSQESLRRYLEARSPKYSPLGCAGDALTVDDSTVGGARACLLAREAGHAVTFFVNPAQIARGRPYWFARLDAILDHRTVQSISFEGQEFDLRDAGRGVRAFRLAVKSHLMPLNEADTDSLLDELTIRLEARSVVIPEHGRTISLQTLRDLAQRGVQVGNHGWDHRDIGSLHPDEWARDLRLAADWFQSHLGIIPTVYAVPYGLVRAPGSATEGLPNLVLLANPDLQMGFLGDRHWNRRDITAHLNTALT